MGSGQSAEASVEESFITESFIQPEALAYTSSPNDDFRELQPKYLDKFIAEQLQPDESFHNLVSTALDNLYRYLQVNMRLPTLKLKWLIKGGSIGKGTALRGRSDLDCVLVMEGVRDARDLKEKIGGILARLKELLDTDPLFDRGWGIKIIRDDKYLVQIEMQHFQWNEKVEVDILPSFYANVYNDDSRYQLYESMAEYGYYTKQLCSAALVELQRDFIRPKPAKLKNLIRLVKHWCKTYLHCERGQPRVPNSYLLELLTIHVWERAGSPHSFTTALLFKDVMEALYNHSQLDVKWDKYYNTTWIESQRPYVMDPANPYANVYGVVKDWPRVERVARETLQMPLLENYRSPVLDTKVRQEGTSESANDCIIS